MLHDRADRAGELLAERLGLLLRWPLEGNAPAYNTPAGLGGNVEADERVIGLEYLKRGITIVKLLCEPLNFVVEDVGEALNEEEREEVVLELRGVFLAADRARGIPEHLLHALVAEHGTLLHSSTAASRRLGGRLCVVRSCKACFLNERLDCLRLRLLWLRLTCFPPIDGSEGHVQLSRELFLA